MNIARAGINHLPTELLCLVVHEFSIPNHPGYWDGNQSYRDILSIRSVCRRWKAAADGDPDLWTHISTKMPKAVRQLALDYSKRRELDVYAVEDRRNFSGDPLMLEFIVDIVKHTSRWRTLSVQIEDDWWDELDAMFVTPLPKLQELSIVVYNDTYEGLPEAFFNSHESMPNLRSLDLQSCYIPPEFKVFNSNLESLHITNYHQDTQEAEEYLKWLSQMPNLRSLSVEYGDGWDSAQPLSESDAEYVLPPLESFDASGLNSPILARILQQCAKPMYHISASCLYIDEESATLLLRSFAEHAQFDNGRHFKELQCLTFGNPNPYLSIGGFCTRLGISDFPADMSRDTLRRLLDVVFKALDKSILDSVDTISISPIPEFAGLNTEILEVFSKYCPKVKSLKLKDGEFGVVSDFLLQSAEAPPFPCLETISIDSVCDARDGSVLEVVKARQVSTAVASIQSLDCLKRDVTEAEAEVLRELVPQLRLWNMFSADDDDDYRSPSKPIEISTSE